MINILFLSLFLFFGMHANQNEPSTINTNLDNDTLVASAMQVAEELVVTIRNQQNAFATIIDQQLLQELVDTLEKIASRAPRSTSSTCPLAGCQAPFDSISLQQYLCTIKGCLTQIQQEIGCSCGPCCISDTCMGLETLFGFLSCICNKVQALQSAIDILDTQLSGSEIDLLCPCSTAWDIAFRANKTTNYPIASVSQYPNGSYIAIAQTAAPGAGNKVEIYDANLNLITGALNDFLSDVVSVRFSPVTTLTGTRFLAVARQAIVGASPELLIYEFNPTIPSLTLVSSANINANVNALAWRSSGDRLVIAQDILNNELGLYSVNTTSGALTFNSTLDLNGSVVVQQALDWNPVNLNYAVAVTNTVGLNPNIYFVIFDPTVTTMSIDNLASAAAPVTLTSVAWHPSGKYIVAGVAEGIASTAAFTPLNPPVPLGIVFTTDPVLSVAWNQTGSAFGLVIDSAGTTSKVEIYCFSATDPHTLLIDTINFTEDVTVIDWSPNNNFALGATTSGNSGDLIAYSINPMVINTILKAVCDISSKLDLSDPCLPIALHSEPTILLDSPGQIYCLPEDIFAVITIDAEDVSIDLNGRVLSGTIDITSNARRITIKNGTIQGNNPIDNAMADYGVVHTSSNSNEVNFVDVIINGGGSSGPGVKGYTCANIGANATTFLRCSLQGGQGSNDAISGDGGSSLVIQNTAEHTEIIDSELRAGYGGSTNTLTTTSTGNGGHGLIDNGRFTSVRSTFIVAGSGQSLSNLTGNIADGLAVTTGNGGDGVQCAGRNLILNDCRIFGGSGGSLSTQGSGNIGINPGGIVTLGSGGHGINNISDTQLTIDNCYIYGGTCSFVGAADGVAVNGGQITMLAPGYGIFNQPNGSNNDGPVITNSQIHGGTGGGINANNGDIGTIGVPSFFIGGGNAIHNRMNSTKITDCSIIGGNGPGAAVLGNSGNIFDLTMGSSGDGINDASSNMTVYNCIIQSGNGGSFFIRNAGVINAPSKASDAGAGIRLGDGDNSNFALIIESSITTGNGGNSDSNDPLSTGTSGNGGIGIYITDNAQGSQVRNCEIGPMGQSGNSLGGTSGNGGDGIKIDANAGSSGFNIEVSSCNISYTGRVGSATISGIPGEAIRDASCNSLIYSNSSNSSADPVAYTLPVCIPVVAVDAPAGTPFALGTDRLANIYR